MPYILSIVFVAASTPPVELPYHSERASVNAAFEVAVSEAVACTVVSRRIARGREPVLVLGTCPEGVE